MTGEEQGVIPSTDDDLSVRYVVAIACLVPLVVLIVVGVFYLSFVSWETSTRRLSPSRRWHDRTE